MSHHSGKPGGEAPPEIAGDDVAPKDKSGRSGTIARVAVYHDTPDWEELDLERQAPAPKASEAPPAGHWVSLGGRPVWREFVKKLPSAKAPELSRRAKVGLIAAVVAVVVIALALGLGLGLGLKKPATGKASRHYVSHRTGGAAGGAGGAAGGTHGAAAPPAPRGPPPGAATSHLLTDDAKQLRSLMALRAAVDTAGLLSDEWVESKGGGHSYCHWKYIVCDKAGKVVEGINMTTDTFQVVFNGSLPSGAALAGLPGLREIDIRLNLIRGQLPEDWDQLSQLEVIRLDQNQLEGPLPAAWGALSNLRVLSVWDNKLSGPIPEEWGDLQALETLDLSYNRLTGPLPESLAGLAELRELLLDVNKFEGKLPAAWGDLAALERLFLSENALEGPLPAEWAGMTALRELWAEFNKLTGPLPESWGQLASVATLALNDNGLAGAIPGPWGSGLKSLRRLYLYNNADLDGCIPKGLQAQLSGFAVDDFVTDGTGVKGFC